MQNKPVIHVVGAGLAGSECALQLADRGYPVHLYEMRPKQMTQAHKTSDFAEIVCSNSFGSMGAASPPGQLKWEAEKFGSHILKAAHKAHVPSGQALGVDRTIFSGLITEQIRNHPLITINEEVVTSLRNIPRPCVIATGPLTHDDLTTSILEHFEKLNSTNFLYFFDAIAPIIDAESIDHSIVWRADRYDKGTPDYINCPLNKEQYDNLIGEIAAAKKVTPKDFENIDFFEGCMPIEAMVDRGHQTPRFGPMKPVGLIDPKTGEEAYAIVQLRAENKEHTSYNLVGFQTRMTYSEQIRVFRMIPGLQNAEFLKLGSIHRNLYLNSPRLLNADLSSKRDHWLFFAGQITGVEGYFESTCIGQMVAHFIDSKLKDQTLDMYLPDRNSAFGSLLNAITDPEKSKHFQPTNINFGLFPALDIYKHSETHENPKAFLKHMKADKLLRKTEQLKLAKTAFTASLSRWADLNERASN